MRKTLPLLLYCTVLHCVPALFFRLKLSCLMDKTREENREKHCALVSFFFNGIKEGGALDQSDGDSLCLFF